MNQKPKIGIVTLYNNNYGSILQCYSTKMILLKFGYDGVVLSEKYQSNFLDKISKCFNLLCCVFIDKNYLKNKIKMKKAMSQEMSYLTIETRKKMNEFINSELKPKDCSKEELKRIGHSEEYKKIIVGSDQVWNASRNISDFYFLRFSDKGKRIAFGPSIGISEIPKFNNKIKKKINEFDSISLREESAIKEISKFYNGEINHIGDPTIMLNADDWIEFGKESTVLDDKYAFIHFLNKPSKSAMLAISQYLNLNKMKSYAMGYWYDEYETINDIKLINGSPRDYVAYINKSEMVFTDSFHTTLFSINMNKKFNVFSRQYLHNYSQGSRIVDLLKRYGLESHYYEYNENKLDNSEVNIDLSIDRDKTIRFLKKELDK